MPWPQRSASHAGSWYEDNPQRLKSQLDGWVTNAGPKRCSKVRGIISPHAGYTYSGPTAAHCFKEIDPHTTKRIFILGPSHHYYLNSCALTTAEEYCTPLGNLKIDQQVNADLGGDGDFQVMSPKGDLDEHSLEMQMPYIARIQQLAGRTIPIVPVLVGSLDERGHLKYGTIFAPYLDNPENVFVISSDFCHWGSRFDFQHYEPSWGAIHESIERLDKMGISLIEKFDYDGFMRYLKNYNNTICGRHPICIFLKAIGILKFEMSEFKFHSLNYAQSTQCQSNRDSSVSYYAGVLTLE